MTAPGTLSSAPPPGPRPPRGFDIPPGVDGTVTFAGGGIGIIGPFVVPGFLAGHQVVGEQLGRLRPVASRLGVPDGLGDLAMLGEPFSGAPVQRGYFSGQ